MTKEEAIENLSLLKIFDAPDLNEAVKMAVSSLRDQRAPAKPDRSGWEGCETCNNTPGIMFGTVTLSIGKQFLSTRENEFKFCPHCGRPLTEEAWADLERRIGGNNGTADI